MDSQKWLLLLRTIQQEEVYSWILSAIGSTIMSLYPSKEPVNRGIIPVLASTLLARFSVESIDGIMGFFNFELKNLPLAYLVAGLLGDGFVTLIRNLKNRVSSDSTAGKVFNVIMRAIGLKDKKDD